MVYVRKSEKFSPDANDSRVNLELFADSKEDVTPNMTIEVVPGYSIKTKDLRPGTKLVTAAGEEAYLKSDKTWNWVEGGDTPAPTPGASDLSDLGDVDVSSPSDGQILAYDEASSKWKNTAAGGGGTSEPFFVRITGSVSDGDVAFDKMFSEIQEAFYAGRQIYAICSGKFTYGDNPDSSSKVPLMELNTEGFDKFVFSVVTYDISAGYWYQSDIALDRDDEISILIRCTMGANSSIYVYPDNQ